MVRGPKSGNGTRSPVYYLDSAGLVPPRPPARELYSEMDPLAAGMSADGSLAADPGIGGSWQGGGGRWLLWPLRVVLWGALLVIAFRGITALNRFEVRGVSLTGLGGAVAFDSIGALHVPPGGATRQITVTVIWQLPDQSGSAAGNPGMTSKLEMTYSMSAVDLHSGKWYVKEIGASTETVGAR